MPSKLVPPLPGVTPATICVPYSLHALVCSCPVAPVMPWVTTRVFLLTNTLMRSSISAEPGHLTAKLRRVNCWSGYGEDGGGTREVGVAWRGAGISGGPLRAPPPSPPGGGGPRGEARRG